MRKLNSSEMSTWHCEDWSTALVCHSQRYQTVLVAVSETPVRLQLPHRHTHFTICLRAHFLGTRRTTARMPLPGLPCIALVLPRDPESLKRCSDFREHRRKAPYACARRPSEPWPLRARLADPSRVPFAEQRIAVLREKIKELFLSHHLTAV